jgi:hypothetical protein
MIHRLASEYHRHDRDIVALTYALEALLVAIAARTAFLVYHGQFDGLWLLLAPTTSLVASLLVVRVANRVIASGNIAREDDRRQEVLRTTHHLIAITKDLKGRVEFVKKQLENGATPLALSQIAESIEDRYETLLGRDAYRFLPGNCIDIITKISGSIFGIGLLAACTQQLIVSAPAAALKAMPNKNIEDTIAQLDELTADIQKLLDELFRLRESIDSKDNADEP